MYIFFEHNLVQIWWERSGFRNRTLFIFDVIRCYIKYYFCRRLSLQREDREGTTLYIHYLFLIRNFIIAWSRDVNYIRGRRKKKTCATKKGTYYRSSVYWSGSTTKTSMDRKVITAMGLSRKNALPFVSFSEFSGGSILFPWIPLRARRMKLGFRYRSVLKRAVDFLSFFSPR